MSVIEPGSGVDAYICMHMHMHMHMHMQHAHAYAHAHAHAHAHVHVACTSLSRARFGFRSTLQLPQHLAPIHTASLQLTEASSSDAVVAVRKFEPIEEYPLVNL